MEFIYITNDPELASYAQDSGVDRIMVDLEHLGKAERQKNRNTLISYHSMTDVSKIRSVIGKSKLLVRVNPIHVDSKKEIDEAVQRGADIIMLPMFKTSDEVKQFISFVNGRAITNLLLETSQALTRIDEILQVEGIDEIHVGLNDLHLCMGLDFMFELLSGGIVEYIAEKVKKRGIKFGFGGISRLGGGALDSRLILSEHVRLGSEMVILSRDFHGCAKDLQELNELINLSEEVKKVRAYILELSMLSDKDLIRNKEKMSQIVSKFVKDRIQK